MNYNALRFFSVLAQTEHYTVAAARLGISQPALSTAIHNLENELGGVKLFKKVGRNIRLTEEGRFYQERVDAALKELHDASLMLRNSNAGAPVIIRLGFVSGTLDGALGRVIAEYSRDNPRIRFHLTESSAEVLMDMVRQEKLDAAVLDSTDHDRSLHFRPLHQRSLYAALPEGHPLAEKPLLTPQEVLRERQIVYNYNVDRSFSEWATGHASDENILCTVNTAQAALDLVAAGMGIAFVPKKSTRPRPGVRFVPLANWHQALYVCILFDRWLEPLVWDFVELAVKTLRETGKD